jgi:hypothetical protein
MFGAFENDLQTVAFTFLCHIVRYWILDI